MRMWVDIIDYQDQHFRSDIYPNILSKHDIGAIIPPRSQGMVKCGKCFWKEGTGCRVQVLSLILDSSVGLSAGIQSAGE